MGGQAGPIRVSANETGVFFVLRLLIALAAICTATSAEAGPRWLNMPATPTLPQAARTGHFEIAGAQIWYAEFGRGSPVLLVHGGLANANYWGLLVRYLAPRHRVIVLDSRCHGRSTCGNVKLGYDRMAADVLALLDRRHIRRIALIGWSDGAIIGLDIAIHHPERLTRLFAFAANSNPSGVADPGTNPVASAYLARTPIEYQHLSPTPSRYSQFYAAVTHMWATQPHFSSAQLKAIRVPTWIVDADHDEFIKRGNTDYMARTIGQGELLLPEVSHFAFLQDPEMFNHAVGAFLQ
jgi:pimeloyl-ACP methyl ester carboxylesterase